MRPVDLLSGGHAIPAREMTIGKRVTAQGRLLRIVVRVDPGETAPGEYTGQLPIAVAGRVVETVELNAKFRSLIWRDWFTTCLALGAILVGASAGAILKWLSNTGAKLQALESRYQRVMALLGSSRLPSSLQQRLVSIQTSLAAQDAAQAEAQLAQVVDSHLDAVVRIGADFERHAARLEAQRRKIQRLRRQG